MNEANFTLVAVLGSAFLFGCASVPAKYAEHPEFGSFVREANGRFLGCYGYSLSVPGVVGFGEKFSIQRDVLPIPGTGDFWQNEGHMAYNGRAYEFARDYNTWLLAQK